jgi:hypothetical protein
MSTVATIAFAFAYSLLLAYRSGWILLFISPVLGNPLRVNWIFRLNKICSLYTKNFSKPQICYCTNNVIIGNVECMFEVAAWHESWKITFTSLQINIYRRKWCRFYSYIRQVLASCVSCPRFLPDKITVSISPQVWMSCLWCMLLIQTSY